MTRQLKNKLLTTLGLGEGNRSVIGRKIYDLTILGEPREFSAGDSPENNTKHQERLTKLSQTSNRLMGI